MALELDSRYPGRFNPGDANYPQGSFKNRTAPGALDGSYLEKDWANDKEGFFQRLLLQAGISPNGAVDTALSSQYYEALLRAIQTSPRGAVASIAAASNINLTTSAPSTDQITITGTGVNIAGFTVAANRIFLVRMTGATNTLVNSATLITGRGTNIAVSAGDSFWMRSTAANTIEILCGSFLVDASIGSRGQTWQNLTASRAIGTTYTNTTGRPIFVIVNVTDVTDANGAVFIDGVSTGPIDSGLTQRQQMWFLVPAGSTYRLQPSMTLSTWLELR